jgi:glycosyltransferase involved in cell wall biosynthesis
MNVVMAGYQAISILHGGPNTQLRNTARHLGDLGVNVTLFDSWSAFRPEACDIFHLFAANIGTYHLAREIHVLGVPLVVSPIIYSLHSARFIRTALAATRLVQRAGKGLWSDYALAADVCGWADRIFPNTQAEADLVVNGLGISSAGVRVVPNGVDPRFADGDPTLFRKKYGLEGFILNVGHIGHPRKNVLSLIRALGAIDHPSVIIGRIISGPYGDACVKEAARHKQILLLDGLDNGSEMLQSAYAACDVFVLPSLFETPGIAALEAGLAGAKVVITQHGGTKEYFAGLAEYVDPSSVESIRSGILRAHGKPRDERLKQRILGKYLWRHVAEATAQAYREIGARRRM